MIDLWQTPTPTQPVYFFTLNANLLILFKLFITYTFPNFGIAGSQITNLYPFDSDPFCSASILLSVNVILLPFSVGEKANVGAPPKYWNPTA